MAKIKEPYVKVEEIIMKSPTIASNASNSNIGGVIIAPVGPRLAYVTSPVEFLKLYTTDGLTIPRNADTTFINAYYLSYSSGLVLSRSLNTNAVGGVLIYRDNDTTLATNYVIKDDEILDMTSTITFELSAAPVDGVEPAWAFVMNDTVYYSYQLRNEIMTMPKYINYTLFKECESIYDMVSILENTDGVHVTNVAWGSNTHQQLNVTIQHTEFEVSQDVDVLNFVDFYSITVSKTSAQSLGLPDRDKWVFSIVGEIPLGSDSNLAKLTNFVESSAKGDTFDLELTEKDDGSNNPVYKVSLDPDCTDKNGVNLYIEYLNTQNIGFHVTVYNQKVKLSDLIYNTEAQSLPELKQKFGNSGFSETESKKEAHIFEALDYLADQEIYDVEYLTPLGLTSSSVAKRFQITSKDKKWFCPIDIPAEYTTYTAVKRFIDAFVNVDYQNMPTGIVLGPFDRNTSLTGWYNDIAASTLYYERVMLNKQANAEFAPVFRNDYGRMNYSNPYKLFKKTERVDLLSLDKPVNWTVYSQRDNIYYMNDNRTFQEDQDSVVCEEQNARIVWKISKDVARIVDQFIGKYNTRTTRASVVDAITYYLEWNIMNKKFPPEAYLIQCDEYNNPDSLINENKLAVELKIRLYKAIKYVTVINRVFPLGMDFNTNN